MNGMKRILALAVAFVMLVGMAPSEVMAAKKITLKNCTTKKVMAVGSTFVIKTNKKAAKITFKSSKKSVATVDASGMIRAKKKGKATITLSSGKAKKKIKLTVKKPQGYTISKKAGTYTDSVTVKVKAKKGYTVYYANGGKLKSSKKIKAKKSRTFTIKKTTTLKLYTVKGNKKIRSSKLRKSAKKYKNYNEYCYKIVKKADKENVTPTPSVTATPGPIFEKPKDSQFVGDDALADYVAAVKAEYDADDTNTEAGEGAVEITIPTEATGSKTETDTYTISKKNKLTIIAPGTYIVHTESTETPSDGLIEIDPETTGLVHVILDGVSLTSTNNTEPKSDTGLITVKKSAERVVLTVKEGTTTTLNDTGATGIDEDDGVSTTYTAGVVCKKTPLTINGSGTLQISSVNGNGIKATDSLKILDTTIAVGNEENVTGHNGVTAKTGLFTKNADISVCCQNDAFKTTLDENDIAEEPTWADLGNMEITGGVLNFTSHNADAIEVYRTLYLNPTELTATTKNAARSTEDGSYKAIKAGTTIEVPETAGVMKADTTDTVVSATSRDGNCQYADDTMHCDGSIKIAGGALTLKSGDDGIHADKGLLIAGGTIAVEESYEGMEAADISIAGGNITIVAKDDGMNAGGGNDSGSDGMGGDHFHKPPTASTQNYQIVVSGGTLTVDSEGDGIDSNGNLFFKGGAVCVNGPTTGGNGSLDYGERAICEVSGGTLMAAGPAGMLATPTSGSSQPVVTVVFSGNKAANTHVAIKDASAITQFIVKPTKEFQTLILSSPKFTLGGTYGVWEEKQGELMPYKTFTFTSASVLLNN